MRGMTGKSIPVNVSDGTVTLDGTVDSWIARDTRKVLRGPRQACALCKIGCRQSNRARGSIALHDG